MVGGGDSHVHQRVGGGRLEQLGQSSRNGDAGHACMRHRTPGALHAQVDHADELHVLGGGEQLEPHPSHSSRAGENDALAHDAVAGVTACSGPGFASRVLALEAPLTGIRAPQQGELPAGPIRPCPLDTIGDDALHVGMVVDGILLVAWAEEEDAPMASPPGAPAAEDLAARERAHENEFVGSRHVEELAVHLLLVDDDRVRDSAGDRMGRVDRPDQLPVRLSAPAKRAGRPHQPREDLRVVRRVQHDKPHTGQHVPVDAVDDLV